MQDKLFAISQTGVSHLLADTERYFSPCQDSYKIVDFPGEDIPDWNGSLHGTIIAVADGHGNPVYHGSSEFGSKLAVEAATECMLELVTDYEKTKDVEIFWGFPKMVTTAWRMRVLEHAKGRFPEKDLRKRFSKEQAYEDYLERIYMDYGSTLLVTVVLPEEKLLIAAQIGDGDILMMYHSDPKGEVHRLADENPRREFGSNVTDSLCMYRADERFQMEILDGKESSKDAEILEDFVLLVATDGISSGALSEMHYLDGYCKRRMENYMLAERQSGRHFMRRYIENEMEKEMRFYSTDDMTVVFMAVNDRDDEEGEDGKSKELAEKLGLEW